MIRVYLIYVALCSFTQAVYISRMSPINRMSTVNRMRGSVFRPGVSLQSLQPMQRPWSYGSMRLTQAASHRAPYVLYRNAPKRYAIKYSPSATRNIFAQSPWKTTARLPQMSPVTPEYEFVKAASAQPVHTDGGAIHTIPAPNLSLSEKPIVVIETSENPISEHVKPSYEVTEKYPEGEYSVAKIESPVGFSKSTSFSTPELQTLIRNGAALQLASEYSLPVTINQHPILPQQFQMQVPKSMSSLPTHQDLLNSGAEGLFIPPNALYQSDPMFLQKLQSQLMQRFPAVEFIPYNADVPNQVHVQPQAQASQHHPQIVLLENEQLNKPIAIHVPERTEQKNVVQRETQEAAVVTLVPQSFVAPNTTERQVEATTPQQPQQPQNITVQLVAADSQPSTTIKYVIETNTEVQNTTPIYYAQVGQSVGNVIANGFYSAINDVRAAAAMEQVEKTPEKPPEKPVDNITTTTLLPDLKAYFVKSDEKSENTTSTELKSLLGVPFTKATDSVKVAYTLVRADDKQQPKVTQEGAVYAGQIVEATISEDQDFNKEKATLMSRRAPIRLLAVADSNNIASAVNSVSIPKVTAVKARIPPKSKLTFDDKTGEPILRIYASYVDNPSQKDAVVSKLAALKPAKDTIMKKDILDWRGATIKAVSEKSKGFDENQVTQFGLKLRERNDDYIPLFEEYDD
ncbi:uncharacterized protein LOC142973485 isoform X2 [Anticarsia gemmatalis]|uniref:uncharacterized protein LOC142973485 isoform X2 n=1 Tax=Anticarsia gemmatalis TaxID=129554 RepID=UPI003F7679AC